MSNFHPHLVSQKWHGYLSLLTRTDFGQFQIPSKLPFWPVDSQGDAERFIGRNRKPIRLPLLPVKNPASKYLRNRQD